MITRTSIEADISHHCNLSCSHCNRFAPHFKQSYYDIKVFSRDVKRLADYCRCDRFLFLGGEPLLNPMICEYVDAAVASGISESMHLWTNGRLMPVVDAGILRRFDKIMVSVYPEHSAGNVDSPQVYDPLAMIRGVVHEKTSIESWIEQNRSSLPPIELHHINAFRSQFESGPMDYSKTLRSFMNCPMQHHCNTLLDGRYYLCGMSAIGHRIHVNWPNDEGVDIYLDDAEDRISDMISRYENRNPLRTCMYCDTCGPMYPHSQRIRHKIAWSEVGLSPLSTKEQETP
jgi:organic radical activating enzyme